MRVLLWGLALFLGALAAHVVIWRVRPPRRQIRALLRIFFGTLAAGLLGLCGTGPRDAPAAAEALHLTLFFTAVALAYIITYQAVQVDSPSLVITRTIADAGARGVAAGELREALPDEILVLPRLRDLVRDEVVDFDGETYRMNRRGGRFLRVIVLWRRLMGQPVRGG